MRGEVYANGLSRSDERVSQADFLIPLVVDDSIFTGQQLNAVRKRISEMPLRVSHVYFCAIYATKESAPMVDLNFSLVEQPRVFEWHLLNRKDNTRFATDFDGVLCRDPTTEENDNGKNYNSFLHSTELQFRPLHKLGLIVTARLSCYRTHSEKWLSQRGIQYDSLFLLENSTAEERAENGLHVIHKAAAFKKSKAELFVESCPEQSAQIATLSGKPVVCFLTGEFFEPSRRILYKVNKYIFPRQVQKIKQTVARLLRRLRRYRVLFLVFLKKREL